MAKIILKGIDYSAPVSTSGNDYSVCTTAADVSEKVVECKSFILIPGAKITVKFTVTNTTDNPTLNVNNTGAKPIYYKGSAIIPKYLAADCTYSFRYNGTQYDLVGDLDTNTDILNDIDAITCGRAITEVQIVDALPADAASHPTTFYWVRG
ncbi:MAG: hypothetical protein HDR02_00275 [Lachnospiraceae bacterium]|nr:hypothetical protein [Lachnospiraceae bacterium]